MVTCRLNIDIQVCKNLRLELWIFLTRVMNISNFIIVKERHRTTKNTFTRKHQVWLICVGNVIDTTNIDSTCKFYGSSQQHHIISKIKETEIAFETIAGNCDPSISKQSKNDVFEARTMKFVKNGIFSVLSMCISDTHPCTGFNGRLFETTD